MRYYYVYIIECADGSYYVGVTNNVEHRFEMHVLGHDINCYTYNRRPLKLVFYELFDDPAIAIAREKQIKGWRREKKEALIKRDYDLLRKLSRSKTKMVRIIKFLASIISEPVEGKNGLILSS